MISRSEAQRRFDSLKGRERQIAELMLQGIRGPVIARRLGLKPTTIRGYKSTIFGKLGIYELSNNQIEADLLFFDTFQPLVQSSTRKPASEQKPETKPKAGQSQEKPKPSSRSNQSRRPQRSRRGAPIWLSILLIGTVAFVAFLLISSFFGNRGVFLSDFYPVSVEAAGDNFCIGKDPIGDPALCIRELSQTPGDYSHSIFAHADSRVEYDLGGSFDTFETGLLLMGSECGDGATYSVYLDGVGIYYSGLITHADDQVNIRLSVVGGRILRLETNIGLNNDLECDGTVWVEPRLIPTDR